MECNKNNRMVVAGLKFDKPEIKEIANDEGYTNPAIQLLALLVVLGAIIAFFIGNGGSSGLARMGLKGFGAAVGEFGSLAIGVFLSAYIMVYVIRIFKVKPTYQAILRVYGVAVIWLLLKTVFVAVLPSLALAGILFWLAYNFVVLFGLTELTGIKLWQSFLSIVLTFAAVFVIMIVYGMVIKAIFA